MSYYGKPDSPKKRMYVYQNFKAAVKNSKPGTFEHRVDSEGESGSYDSLNPRQKASVTRHGQRKRLKK
jgi:hypothetical protein